MSEIIQGLWIGPRLSAMERMSVNSFLANGHEYHLYTDGEVEGVPPGATLRDGCEILPRSMIFRYREFDTVAGFSNFFRYKLLLERGGWWVDADVVCLRPFDFEGEHVFSSESVNGALVVNSGIIKAPAGSRVMEYAWRVCEGKRTEELRWGETGPRLVHEAVRECGFEASVRPFEVFCPLGYSEWERVLDPGGVEFGPLTHAVHLWNEMWRRAGRDKDAGFHPDCLYERLKAKYLGGAR